MFLSITCHNRTLTGKVGPSCRSSPRCALPTVSQGALHDVAVSTKWPGSATHNGLGEKTAWDVLAELPDLSLSSLEQRARLNLPDFPFLASAKSGNHAQKTQSRCPELSHDFRIRNIKSDVANIHCHIARCARVHVADYNVRHTTKLRAASERPSSPAAGSRSDGRNDQSAGCRRSGAAPC